MSDPADSTRSQQQLYYVRISPEGWEALSQHGIDLVRALEDDGLDVRRRADPDPTAPAEGIRDVGYVIAAIGVSAIPIAVAISKILDAVARNRTWEVRSHRLVPVTDANGQQVRDSQGRPVMQWHEDVSLLEASARREKLSVSGSLGGSTLLSYEIKTG